MVAHSRTTQTLRYGDEQVFSMELEPGRLAYRHEPPAAVADFASELRRQLESPLDFPPLEMAVVPDDRVVIALARHTPGAAEIIAAVWSAIERRSVKPKDVTILQPASWDVGKLPDPRASLPSSVQKAMHWTIHDATDKKRERFLANSANGERIYLDCDVVEADFVLPIGGVGFDPLLGFRSAGSAIFPGLSNTDSMAKARGQDHAELRPTDDRPLRQLQDEVAWLLGVQFGIHVLPSRCERPCGVICGALEASTSAARDWLHQHWFVEQPQRCEIVVASISANADGASWEEVGAALQSARNLVQRGGKIVLLTNLAVEPTDGFRYLQQCESPREAMKPLRLEAPPDVIPASRLASAADWATVYLVSGLNPGLVESLCMTPLAPAEAARLLERGGSCLLLEAAQHTFGYVR
ncbi:MAG: lactate racemase domain-containing protein [Planctomycetaceae bacterium]